MTGSDNPKLFGYFGVIFIAMIALGIMTAYTDYMSFPAYVIVACIIWAYGAIV